MPKRYKKTTKSPRSTKLSFHMKFIGDCYNPKTKLYLSQKQQILEKFGHGYFKCSEIQRTKIPEQVRSFLISYPCWEINQKQMSGQMFEFFFRLMVQAHPVKLYIWEELYNQKPLKLISHINFSYLRKIEIQLRSQVNFEDICWIEADLLDTIRINTKSPFRSLKPFHKTNYRSLSLLRVDSQTEIPNGYDLTNFFRTKLFRSRIQRELQSTDDLSIEGQKAVSQVFVYKNRSLESMLYIAKVEADTVNDFTVPQKDQLRFFNNPPLLQHKLFECLNHKFLNNTDYLQNDQRLNNPTLEQMKNFFTDQQYDKVIQKLLIRWY